MAGLSHFTQLLLFQLKAPFFFPPQLNWHKECETHSSPPTHPAPSCSNHVPSELLLILVSSRCSSSSILQEFKMLLFSLSFLCSLNFIFPQNLPYLLCHNHCFTGPPFWRHCTHREHIHHHCQFWQTFNITTWTSNLNSQPCFYWDWELSGTVRAPAQPANLGETKRSSSETGQEWK